MALLKEVSLCRRSLRLQKPVPSPMSSLGLLLVDQDVSSSEMTGLPTVMLLTMMVIDSNSLEP